MKAFVASLVVGLCLAVGSAFLLNGNFQEGAYSAFATEGARVGDPGDNLVNY